MARAVPVGPDPGLGLRNLLCPALPCPCLSPRRRVLATSLLRSCREVLYESRVEPTSGLSARAALLPSRPALCLPPCRPCCVPLQRAQPPCRPRRAGRPAALTRACRMRATMRQRADSALKGPSRGPRRCQNLDASCAALALVLETPILCACSPPSNPPLPLSRTETQRSHAARESPPPPHPPPHRRRPRPAETRGTPQASGWGLSLA